MISYYEMHIALKNLKRDILRKSKTYMIKSNRYGSLYFINSRIYNILKHLIIKRYSRLPQVSSIYLAHGLALGEVFPGLSDFDLAIIFETSDIQQFFKTIRKPWNRFKRFFPARDMLLFTKREFEHWQNFGGGWEPLDELKHWQCIYGPDLRINTRNVNETQTGRDRFLYSISKYYSLLSTAIKEEPLSPYMAVAARRNLYKAFCSSVLSLDKKYLSINNQFSRLLQWSEDNEEINISLVSELIDIRRNQFHKGSITTLRLSLGALGYKIIDKALENFERFHTPLSNSIPDNQKKIPLSNLTEVKKKIEKLTSGIAELLRKKLESIILISNGSPFGYKLLIILKVGLSLEEIEEALRSVHVIFRIHDDPWFNENFPTRVPIIYSKNMFVAHMHLWPFDKNYIHSHRHILYGKDLYDELIINQTEAGSGNNFEDEFVRLKINFSRYLHQVYLERLSPALYDVVTLIFPRLYVFHKLGWAPSTAEEAIYYYEKIKNHEYPNFPKIFFEKYGNKNVDTITRSMNNEAFEEVWDFLTDEFSFRTRPDKVIKQEN